MVRAIFQTGGLCFFCQNTIVHGLGSLRSGGFTIGIFNGDAIQICCNDSMTLNCDVIASKQWFIGLSNLVSGYCRSRDYIIMESWHILGYVNSSVSPIPIQPGRWEVREYQGILSTTKMGPRDFERKQRRFRQTKTGIETLALAGIWMSKTILQVAVENWDVTRQKSHEVTSKKRGWPAKVWMYFMNLLKKTSKLMLTSSSLEGGVWLILYWYIDSWLIFYW